MIFQMGYIHLGKTKHYTALICRLGSRLAIQSTIDKLQRLACDTLEAESEIFEIREAMQVSPGPEWASTTVLASLLRQTKRVNGGGGVSILGNSSHHPPQIERSAHGRAPQGPSRSDTYEVCCSQLHVVARA